ncbi:MAG: TGS domain-containing protein, partial [Spirochaetes bacterium]|nr:TGS domain-containing protein [Spirochaetota bacterium]
ENKFTDKKGRVLPDAFLLKKGSTPKDLAFMVHTDIGNGFLYAVDGRTKMRMGEKHELKNGDIVKIVAVK